jgi:putative lipoic acid-binding regulatory protein
MDSAWLSSFQKKLDDFHSWPTLYVFKFIVPKGKEDELRQLFPLHTASEKESKNGNYTSLTLQMMMPSADAVIQVYKKAAIIEGIIAL